MSDREKYHGPAARKLYAWDWTQWLADGDTIASATIAPVTGLAISAPLVKPHSVTVWVEGGTNGVTYAMGCAVVTTLGEEETSTMTLRCRAGVI